MSDRLSAEDWDVLKSRVASGKCTPFLGAGMAAEHIPLGSAIAKQWAEEYGYPLDDVTDLAKVAQYIAVQHGDAMFPKEKFIASFVDGAARPAYESPDEPYHILARLGLPVYMTTNYDSFLFDALDEAGRRPRLEYCRWNDHVLSFPSAFDAGSDYQPSPEEPLVFHLHGHHDVVESMVLTEDDYLDFIVHVSRDPDCLPKRVERALTGTSLVFIGYSLKDWSFRVLFRGLIMAMEESLRRLSVTVQLQPGSADEQAYIDQYYRRESMSVYWGTAREFVRELCERCGKPGAS